MSGVVDEKHADSGRLQALRYGASSIMPEHPSGNTQAPVMAIAEIASNMVVEDNA